MQQKEQPQVVEDNPRFAELRDTLFRLNDAMRDRLMRLQAEEKAIFTRLRTGRLSLDAKRVDAYKLADRIPARSLRMNIRIHQRNLLYFNMRRRQLHGALTKLGADPAALEDQWRQSKGHRPSDTAS
jgi:hypothetical protein